MFEHAGKLGLEGIVSKHGDRAYRAGRSSTGSKSKTRRLRAAVEDGDGHPKMVTAYAGTA